MYFSKEFLAGISFACVGVAGMAFLLSRRNNPTTDECEPKNMEEDLEGDTDEFFDAETGSFRSKRNENLNKITQSKSIKELYMDAADKNAFREVQHDLEVCKMNCLALQHHMADAIYTIKQTVVEQRLSIDGLRSEVSDVKRDLNRVVVLLKTAETTSAERNTDTSEEKPDNCKVGRQKTRISILEREVTKKSSEINGMHHMFRALNMLTRPVSGAALTSAGENRSERITRCHQPSAPASSSFQPAAGPPPVHPVTRSPSPPSAVTSKDFGPPPPPSPPAMMQMTTGTAAFRSNVAKMPPCASEVVEAGGDVKTEKTYSRIVITEESLRSVVLKPVPCSATDLRISSVIAIRL